MIVKITKKAGFLLAVAGAAVVGGATTALVTAAIPSSTDGQIHSCYRSTGSLRVIDSEANQTCTAQETSLSFGQKSNILLKDNNGQVLGDLLGASKASSQSALVFNRTVNRTVEITYDTANNEYVIGEQQSPLFESPDCSGQPYTQLPIPSLSAKNVLYRWNDGTNTLYGLVGDNATSVPRTFNSGLTSADNVTFYCQSGAQGEYEEAYPLTIVAPPISNIAIPLKF